MKEECQLALLSFSKAGAKVRTLKHNFQMFRKFFHFSFPRPKFRKKPMAKKRKMEAYRSVLLSECQNIAAFVPESGCKSRAFTDICKIYTSFFEGLRELFHNSLIDRYVLKHIFKGKRRPERRGHIIYIRARVEIDHSYLHIDHRTAGTTLEEPKEN